MHHHFDKELSQMMHKAFRLVVGGIIDIDQKLIRRLPSLPNTNYAEDSIQDVVDLLAQGYMQRETKFYKMQSLRPNEVQNIANG